MGFGADAHSFAGGERWQNVEMAQDYVAAAAGRGERSAANAAEERFFVGLRLSEGVTPTAEEWALHDTVIERFLDAGLLDRDSNRLWLTPRGVLLSNEIFQEFLAA